MPDDEDMARTLSQYLNDLINAGARDDDEIIEKALISIPRDVIDAHLRRLLRSALADVWHTRRGANGILSGPKADGRRHPGITDTDRRANASAQPNPVTPAGRPSSSRSRKVEQIRASAASGKLAAWYRDEIYTGAGKVRLGAATVAELLAAAAWYEQTAHANLEKAARLRKVAKVVEDAGVEKVDELPEAVALGLADE
jgi:hypothetical protein